VASGGDTPAEGTSDLDTSWDQAVSLGTEQVVAPWHRPGGSPLQMSPRAKLITFWAIVVLSVFFLWLVRGVLTPFVIAVVLAYVFNPLVARVSQGARLPRGLAVAGIYVVLAMLLTWSVLVIFPVAAREARELAATLPRLLIQIQSLLAEEQTIIVFGAQVNLAPVADEITRTLGGLVTTASHRLVETAVSTVETLLRFILALVATFYLLMAGERIKHGIRNLTPPRYRQEFGPVVAEIDRILGRFVRGELLLIIIMSFATWLALSILGIRYALILGLIAGVLELIPFIGPILAAVPAVALALFQPSPFGWSPMVNAGVVALVYFVLRHAEDYFVIPQVVGRVVELHPLLAMFAVFSGAAVGGILGMFLGVPIAAVLRILVRYAYFKLVEEAK
jgi:predicted PurR-regulated permease PerM